MKRITVEKATDGISAEFILEAETERKPDHDTRVLRAWAAGIAACAAIAALTPAAISAVKVMRGQNDPSGTVDGAIISAPDDCELVVYGEDYVMYPETEYKDADAPKTASVTVGGVTFEGEYVASVRREGRQYADVVHMYKDADGVEFAVDGDGALVSFDGSERKRKDFGEALDDDALAAKAIEYAKELFPSGSIVYEIGDENHGRLYSGLPYCAYDFQKTVGGVKCAPYLSITLFVDGEACVRLEADRTWEPYDSVTEETARMLAYSDEAEAAVRAMLAEKYASNDPEASFNCDIENAKRTLYIVDEGDGLGLKAMVEYSMICVSGGEDDDPDFIYNTTVYVTYTVGAPQPDDGERVVYENGEHGVTLEQTGVSKITDFISDDARSIYYEDVANPGPYLGISVKNESNSAISVISSAEIWRRENGEWVRRYGYEGALVADDIEAGSVYTYDLCDGYGVVGDEFLIYLEFEQNGEHFYVKYEFTAKYPCRHQIMRDIDGVPVDNFLGVNLRRQLYSSMIYEGEDSVSFEIRNLTDRAVSWRSGRTDKYTNGKWETVFDYTDFPPVNTLAAKEKNTDYMLNLYTLDIPFDMDAGTYRHYILVTDADGKQFYVSYDFTVNSRLNASELWATGALSVGMTKDEIFGALPSYWQKTNYEIGGGSFALYFVFIDDVKSSIAVVYDENDVSTNIAPLGAGVDRQFILDCLGKPDIQDKSSVLYTFGRIVDEDKSEKLVELTVTFDAEGNYEDWTCDTSVILPDGFPQVILDYADSINDKDYEKLKSLYMESGFTGPLMRSYIDSDWAREEEESGLFSYDNISLTSAEKTEVRYKASSSTDYEHDWSQIIKREEWKCHLAIKTKHGGNEYKVYEFEIYYMKDGRVLIGDTFQSNSYSYTPMYPTIKSTIKSKKRS